MAGVACAPMRPRFYENLPIFLFGLVIGLFIGILIGGW